MVTNLTSVDVILIEVRSVGAQRLAARFVTET
jgi:hypothetical protein